jgi:hypothetical protein
MIILLETTDPDTIRYKRYLSECIRTNDFTRFRESELDESIKDIWNFIKELAASAALKIGDLVRALKNKKIFTFFSAFDFNLKNIVKAFKGVYDFTKKLAHFIPGNIAKGLLKGWRALPEESRQAVIEGVKKADRIIKSMGKFGNVVFATFLVWVYLEAGITGDVSYDFTADEPINALRGKLTVNEFFLGDNGDGTNSDGSVSFALEYLGLIIAGKLGVGGILPYAQFSNGIFLTVSLFKYFAKELGIKINKGRNSDTDMASAMAAVT